MSELDSEFKKIFEAVDTDRSGRISATELQQALASTGESVSMQACDLLIGLFDDGTGSVDLQGFIDLCQLPTTWKTVFKSFDQDSSGFIDEDELEMAMKKIFEPAKKFDHAYVQLLVTKFGDPAGGGLNENQFLLACSYVQKEGETKLKLK